MCSANPFLRSMNAVAVIPYSIRGCEIWISCIANNAAEGKGSFFSEIDDGFQNHGQCFRPWSFGSHFGEEQMSALVGGGDYQLILGPSSQVNEWPGWQAHASFLLELDLIALIKCEYIQMVLRSVNYTTGTFFLMLRAFFLVDLSCGRSKPPHSICTLCFFTKLYNSVRSS